MSRPYSRPRRTPRAPRLQCTRRESDGAVASSLHEITARGRGAKHLLNKSSALMLDRDRRLCHWEADHEPRSPAGRVLDMDRAMVCRHDRSCDREAEARSPVARRASVLDRAEPFEDPRTIPGRNPGSIVRDRELDVPIELTHRKRNTAAGMARRIGREVLDHAGEVGVAPGH